MDQSPPVKFNYLILFLYLLLDLSSGLFPSNFVHVSFLPHAWQMPQLHFFLDFISPKILWIQIMNLSFSRSYKEYWFQHFFCSYISLNVYFFHTFQQITHTHTHTHTQTQTHTHTNTHTHILNSTLVAHNDKNFRKLLVVDSWYLSLSNFVVIIYEKRLTPELLIL